MPSFWWFLFPFLTPSNLSHHCNFYKNVPPLPCQNLTRFCPRYFTDLDPRLRKCIKQRTAWALPRNLCQTARVKRVSCCWKRPSPRRLYSAWSTDSCDSWEQVNNSMMQILIISHFVLLSLSLGFLKISNCLEPGNWPKTKRLRAKDVIGSWNQGHSEDQNCPFSCDVSESQYLIIYPNHPFLGVVVLSSGAAFLYCF